MERMTKVGLPMSMSGWVYHTSVPGARREKNSTGRAQLQNCGIQGSVLCRCLPTTVLEFMFGNMMRNPL